jgi:hypothetical protein
MRQYEPIVDDARDVFGPRLFAMPRRNHGAKQRTVGLMVRPQHKDDSRVLSAARDEPVLGEYEEICIGRTYPC